MRVFQRSCSDQARLVIPDFSVKSLRLTLLDPVIFYLAVFRSRGGARLQRRRHGELGSGDLPRDGAALRPARLVQLQQVHGDSYRGPRDRPHGQPPFYGLFILPPLNIFSLTRHLNDVILNYVFFVEIPLIQFSCLFLVCPLLCFFLPSVVVYLSSFT